MRIYKVTAEVGGKTVERLVEAKHKSEALAHVVAATMKVERADQADLVRLVKAGVAVEKASAPSNVTPLAAAG